MLESYLADPKYTELRQYEQRRQDNEHAAIPADAPQRAAQRTGRGRTSAPRTQLRRP